MSTHRSIAALAGLFLWASIPASLGQPPAKASDAGTIPEWHGIAAVHSHHADLAMLILEDEDHRTEPGKRLRAELRIREDQPEKLARFLQKKVDPATKEEDAADAINAMDAMEETFLAGFRKGLSDKQQARFEELCCQFAGPMVLRLKYYAARLHLSEAQRKRIIELVNTYDDKSGPFHRALFVARSDEAVGSAQKKLVTLARELDEKVLHVLTEKQRAEWLTLLGKRFDWKGILEE